MSASGAVFTAPSLPHLVALWALSAALLGGVPHALRLPVTGLLVGGEIGPLELRGHGLAPVLASDFLPAHLVVVVRAGLVDAAWQAFGLGRWPARTFAG